jgi:DNA polymerase III epsilon subunit-like protein
MFDSVLNSTRAIQVNREFGRLAIASYHGHVCTLELSHLRLHRLPDETLETVYRCLFHDAAFIRQNHRALDDARMTAKIWLAMEGE